MEIFISWSGDRSRTVARALREWLRCVIQSSRPWMSEEDLGPGIRWSIELAKKLETTNFGVICLTKESLSSPWVLFEAGALAKALSEALVCPYLVDLAPRELPPPLSQFNAVSANESGTFQLLRSINRAIEQSSKKELIMDEELLRRTFDKWWPELHAKLESLPQPVAQPTVITTAANNMGIEYVYEGRGPALEKFAEYLEDEIANSQYDQDAGIFIVGTSMRAFLVPSEINFDGRDILKRALENNCPLRFMLTKPDVGDGRWRQEGRAPGLIPGEIRQSVRDLSNAGMPRDAIRYYEGSPTVFGIATTQRMLLNPYPYEQEAHRCFTLIVRKTDYRKDIYHQYRKYHFEQPWQNALSIPEVDWAGLRAV